MAKQDLFEARGQLAERAAVADLGVADGMREMRAALGLSQEAFGRLFGLTRRQVNQIENGAANPTVATLTRVAEMFGLRVGFVPVKRN